MALQMYNVKSVLSKLMTKVENLEGKMEKQMSMQSENFKLLSENLPVLSDTIEPMMEKINKLSNCVKEVQHDLRNPSYSPATEGEPSADDEEVTLVKRTYAGTASSGIDSKGLVVKMKEAMHEYNKETQEKEERAKNVVIFRAKESQADRRTRETEDCEFVRNFLAEIECSDVTAKKITRLGRRETNKDRPLRFSVENTEQKSRIMENLNKLRESDPPLNSISVCHDLMPKQRDAQKELLTQAKELSDNSEDFLFKVICSKGPYWEGKIQKRKRRT